MWSSVKIFPGGHFLFQTFPVSLHPETKNQETMVKRKTTSKKNSKIKVDWTCRDCQNCEPVTEFHTLSMKGEPTLGRCPYWTQSKSVLLSLDYCTEHFKRKDA